MNAVLQPTITAAEQAKRQSEVDFAKGSVRLEGVILTPEIDRINQDYISGLIDSREHTTLCLAAIDRDCAQPA